MRKSRYYCITIVLTFVVLGVFFFYPSPLIDDNVTTEIYLCTISDDAEDNVYPTIRPDEDETAKILELLSACEKQRKLLFLQQSGKPFVQGNVEILLTIGNKNAHLFLGSQNIFFYEDSIFKYRIMNSNEVRKEIFDIVANGKNKL